MANIDRDELMALLIEHLDIRIDAWRDQKNHTDEVSFSVAITFDGQIITADHHTLVLPPLD